jgi:Tfp pilus assembly protein PilN
MIEINLLPHREAKRAADLRQTVAVLALGLLGVSVVIAIIDGTVRASQASAEESIRKLEAEIAIHKPEEERARGQDRCDPRARSCA